MISVVIAAHNEGATIGACLDTLLSGSAVADLDVTVVANGCTDDTADIARSRRVRVLETPVAGKALALNVGDRVAEGYPRVYLDADIPLTADDIKWVVEPLGRPGPAGCPVLAAVPARSVEVAGRPRLVRMYYAVSVRHPAYGDGLFGRGAIAVSREGRLRFTDFPLFLADDLFLDAQFAATEKVEVGDVTSRVETPTRTHDLVRRLARVRRGNAQLRARARQGNVRSSSGLGWLGGLLREEPGLAPCVVAYVGITVVAALRGRWGRPDWGQDAGSRSAMQAQR